MKSSSYSGFFKLSVEERMKEVAEFCALTPEEQAILKEADSLDMDKADHMIENVIGRFTLPMGVGINFVINGKDYVIPMVTEEPSVVAACSNAAKMARPGGGFTTDYTGSVMISQIQLLDVPAPFYAKGKILENKEKIAEICNAKDPMLVKLGGGVKDVEVRVLDSLVGPMVVVHLLVDRGRHGRQRGEHYGRGRGTLPGGAYRRPRRAAYPLQPGRPPNRPRPRRLQEGRHWRGKGCR